VHALPISLLSELAIVLQIGGGDRRICAAHRHQDECGGEERGTHCAVPSAGFVPGPKLDDLKILARLGSPF
jgi:hypothetical protein